MQYTGELISIGVAVSWTITALSFEYAGKKIGALSLNIIRLVMAILMLGITLSFFTGDFIPFHASREAWLWLSLSGFVGYVLGDYCLFNSYLIIGSRLGQLFMTLAPPSAALTGMILLGETMSSYAILGMFVTMFGIGLSIFSKGGNVSGKWQSTVPIKGILLGIGAGVGQGVGIVLSKIGMSYTILPDAATNSTAAFLLPFAATQMRAVTGVLGFIIILLLAGQSRQFFRSFSDGKAMTGATLGTFFGPFVGVSFSLMAVQYTTAGVASTLMALTPIIILIPSRLLFKQPISAREIIGAVISVCGVSLFFI
jgi:EamA-like transporter family.